MPAAASTHYDPSNRLRRLKGLRSPRAASGRWGTPRRDRVPSHPARQSQPPPSRPRPAPAAALAGPAARGQRACPPPPFRRPWTASDNPAPWPGCPAVRALTTRHLRVDRGQLALPTAAATTSPRDFKPNPCHPRSVHLAGHPARWTEPASSWAPEADRPDPTALPGSAFGVGRSDSVGWLSRLCRCGVRCGGARVVRT